MMPNPRSRPPFTNPQMIDSLRKQAWDILWILSAVLARSIESLRDNRGLGLLAVGLSFVLWMLITIEQNPLRTDTFPGSIAVKPVNVPSGLDIFGEIEPVRLRITAPLDSWNRLDASRFKVTADLSHGSPGPQEVPVKAESLDSRARISAVLPPQVSVRLETLKREEVPVKVNLQDTVPFGYTFSEPQLSLERVTVLGPAPLVDQVDAAVADVSLSGMKVNIKHSFRLTPRTVRGYLVEGVTLEPASVIVEVPISQQVFYRSVAVSPVVKGEVAPGYWIDSLYVEPSTVTVVGDRDTLQAIAYLQTESVDVSNATADLVRSTTIKLPKGISLVGEQRVLVRVSVAPLLGTQTLPIAPTFKGLAGGKQATTDTDTIRVTMSGAVPILQRILPSQITVTIDLSGLAPGAYALAPEVAMPQGVELLRLYPERIRVVIR